jgi:hypothetical protein
MDIQNTRIGTFNVRDDLVLTFPNGLIDVPGERYVLVAKDESSPPFFWLHSGSSPSNLPLRRSSTARGGSAARSSTTLAVTLFGTASSRRWS